jgi:hypothetical protein
VGFRSLLDFSSRFSSSETCQCYVRLAGTYASCHMDKKDWFFFLLFVCKQVCGNYASKHSRHRITVLTAMLSNVLQVFFYTFFILLQQRGNGVILLLPFLTLISFKRVKHAVWFWWIHHAIQITEFYQSISCSLNNISHHTNITQWSFKIRVLPNNFHFWSFAPEAHIFCTHFTTSHFLQIICKSNSSSDSAWFSRKEKEQRTMNKFVHSIMFLEVKYIASISHPPKMHRAKCSLLHKFNEN